jgi:hypothetical protein
MRLCVDPIMSTYLVRLGASISARDNEGKTAHDLNVDMTRNQRQPFQFWPNRMLGEDGAWFVSEDNFCTIDVVPVKFHDVSSITEKLLSIPEVLKFDIVGYYLFTLELELDLECEVSPYDIFCSMLKEYYEPRIEGEVVPLFHSLLYGIMSVYNKHLCRGQPERWCALNFELKNFLPLFMGKLKGEFYRYLETLFLQKFRFL